MNYEVKGLPWSNDLATNVEDCTTAAEVMHKAKLDWQVAKCNLVAKMPNINLNDDLENGFIHGYNSYKECPNAFAIYRTDKNIPLGIVKDRYTPVQNIDAFTFFNNAIGKNKAVWQTAGYFGYGERIYVSAKLPNTIFVNNDPVDNYLVFTTSHDGTSGIKILFTPVRVICSNILNAAIKSSTNYISFKHTKSVHKNIDIAAEILQTCLERSINLQEQFNAMTKIKMNDTEAQNIFANTVLTEDELFRIKQTGHTIKEIIYRDWRAMEDANISMKKANVINAMTNYYYDGVGQKNILGNAWGVYNAVTGYYSNVDNATGLKRMDSLLYGDKSRKIELAGNLVLAA